MMRRAAGLLVVAILKMLARLPLPVVRAFGLPLIPIYLIARPRMWTQLWKAAPTLRQAPIFPFRYYSMRLRLALLSLRHLLGPTDGCTHIVENVDLYHAALRTGKPIALLGWHQGPVEMLHRIPHADPEAANRFKVLMTAGAFAPALAELMYAGRAVDGKIIARPGDTAALRRWAREQGILAVMIDQVPGRPEKWLPIGNSGSQAPYPERLMKWIEARDSVRLFVTVQWERGNVIRFRYLPMEGDNLISTAIACMKLSETFGQERQQYNWSYPKIRYLPEHRTLGIVREGEPLMIGRINVWDYKWFPESTEYLKLPGNDEIVSCVRYAVNTTVGRTYFLATELSNGVWGFFDPAPDTGNK
jgi:lauroyl/myristoyl acyltransferase